MISDFISKSEKETMKLAEKFAKKLRGGEVIGLIGNLGTGKTIFIKGLAQGLGIKKTITSPSFVLMKVYKTRTNTERNTDRHGKSPRQSAKWLCHVDAYRLKDEKDLIEIGILDWLGKKDTLTVIEWVDRVKKILPKKSIIIKIKFGKKENERVFIIQ